MKTKKQKEIKLKDLIKRFWRWWNKPRIYFEKGYGIEDI